LFLLFLFVPTSNSKSHAYQLNDRDLQQISLQGG